MLLQLHKLFRCLLSTPSQMRLIVEQLPVPLRTPEVRVVLPVFRTLLSIVILIKSLSPALLSPSKKTSEQVLVLTRSAFDVIIQEIQEYLAISRKSKRSIVGQSNK